MIIKTIQKNENFVNIETEEGEKFVVNATSLMWGHGLQCIDPCSNKVPQEIVDDIQKTIVETNVPSVSVLQNAMQITRAIIHVQHLIANIKFPAELNFMEGYFFKKSMYRFLYERIARGVAGYETFVRWLQLMEITTRVLQTESFHSQRDYTLAIRGMPLVDPLMKSLYDPALGDRRIVIHHNNNATEGRVALYDAVKSKGNIVWKGTTLPNYLPYNYVESYSSLCLQKLMLWGFHNEVPISVGASRKTWTGVDVKLTRSHPKTIVPFLFNPWAPPYIGLIDFMPALRMLMPPGARAIPSITSRYAVAEEIRRTLEVQKKQQQIPMMNRPGVWPYEESVKAHNDFIDNLYSVSGPFTTKESVNTLLNLGAHAAASSRDLRWLQDVLTRHEAFSVLEINQNIWNDLQESGDHEHTRLGIILA